MRSPKTPFGWLLEKEWRELLTSRAWWVMLVVIGPLVGVSFISAVRTYAELSGYGGTAEGVGEAFSPLIGIWAPTFSACELAAAFLLPFVAIRVFAADRQSGALKLELQQPMPVLSRVLAKALVLMAGWVVASTPTLLALILWRSYGGSVYPPELIAVILGHFLNAGLTIALASAAASLTDHPATAAIVTLSVTIGTWIVNFVAAVQGGAWERVAEYTPTAMVAEFQHGLVRLDVVLTATSLALFGLVIAAIWMRLGMSVRRHVYESIAAGALTAAAILSFTFVRANTDLSENRMNSFPEPDEAVLERIREPLHIEAHLAAQDPRRTDLERFALSKLRRVLPRVKQFAYFPVAIARDAKDFSNGTISMKFKTISGDSDRCSGIVFNVKPNGDWLAIRYNDTENNVALWEFHNGIRRSVRRGPERKWMLDRAAWHELKMTVDGDKFTAWMDGEVALEYTLGSQPGPGRNGAPPNPDLFPENNPVLRPPVSGRVGLWSKTDSTSYFKDYVVIPK